MLEQKTTACIYISYDDEGYMKHMESLGSPRQHGDIVDSIFNKVSTLADSSGLYVDFSESNNHLINLNLDGGSPDQYAAFYKTLVAELQPMAEWLRF